MNIGQHSKLPFIIQISYWVFTHMLFMVSQYSTFRWLLLIRVIYYHNDFLFFFSGVPPWSNGSVLDQRSLSPVSSNLGVGISEGCFILDFASLPLEVTRPIQPTMCIKVAIKHQSSSSSSSCCFLLVVLVLCSWFFGVVFIVCCLTI